MFICFHSLIFFVLLNVAFSAPDWFDASPGTSSTAYGDQVHTNNQQGFHTRKPIRGEFHDGELNDQSFHTNKPSNFVSGGFNEPNSQASLGGHPNSGFNFVQSGTFGRPVYQGFMNAGHIGRPINQGFGNKPNGQNGVNNQGSKICNGSHYERPFQESLSRPFKPNNRPGNQNLGAPKPFDQDFGTPINSGSFGLNNFMNGQLSNIGGSQRQHPNRRLLPDGNCGIEISDKIIGGTDTNLDEFPWMVLLHFSSRNGQHRGFGCGGSLISNRYVLTAAHCIKGPSLPKNTIVNTVRLGEYDLTKERDCINGVCSPPPIDAAIESVIVHPDYKSNDRGQFNDIALIRLRKKVNFNSYVSPICLPGTEHKTKDFSGKKLIVSGWGKTANGADGQSSPVKQKVSLPFVSLENCKSFYENINIHLKNTQMCAGGEKEKDSCQGDSGGPLMSNEITNGQPSWFITGIVSFGPENCGVKNVAGVYTKVSEYLDWILDNMKE